MVALAVLAMALSGLGMAVPEDARGPLQEANSGKTTKPDTPKVDWSALLPDGEGKSDVAVSCSSCHDLKQVIIQKKSRSNWAATVQKMVSAYQAPLDKEDFPALIAYLAKNFGEDNPIDQLPLDLNTCSAAALARLPGLDSELAKAIVECRKAKGGFGSVDDLLQVKGMDAGRLEKIRMYIALRGN
jgi:competence ComEA-like helix-hairpin-helix protein